jgi:apolipoprotein N-acyltransferase
MPSLGSLEWRLMLFRIAGAALSGLLLWFTLGLTPVWWVAWIAPIPLLWAVIGAGREARWLCYGAALIGLSGNFSYYLKTTGPVAMVVLTVLQMLAWGFYMDVGRRAMARWRTWWVVFVLPAAMAAMDCLITVFSPHGSWGSLGLTQVEFLPVLQVASFAGSAGIVFLMGLFASVVVMFVVKRWDVEGPVLAYGLPVLLLGGALGFGFLRLGEAMPKKHVAVGLVAVDEMAGAWGAYADRSRELVKAGAEVLVWAEKIEKAGPERQAWVGQLAAELRVPMVVGVQVDKRNVAWVFNGEGAWIGEYQKQQLVPYLEADLEPGKKDAVYELKGRRFGVAVCRDLFFSRLARRYGLLDVDAMLVPAWDFYHDAWMASAVNTLMAVQSGYSVVRVGRESYLHAVDSFGRVLVQERSAEGAGRGVIARVPAGTRGVSVYSGVGNSFGWLCVALFVLFAVLYVLGDARVVEYLTGTSRKGGEGVDTKKRWLD